MGAGSKARGRRRISFFFSPTPLPLSVLMHSKPSVWQNYAYFVHGYSRETIERSHASYHVVHMYARADEECFFFFSYHVFASHFNTLSYFARSHLAVAAANNALANMNGRFTADVYKIDALAIAVFNFTRQVSLPKNTLRLVTKYIFLFTQQ